MRKWHKQLLHKAVPQQFLLQPGHQRLNTQVASNLAPKFQRVIELRPFCRNAVKQHRVCVARIRALGRCHAEAIACLCSAPGGALILKTINAANPITGAHGRYLDFTHETSWTEESMRQVLEFRGFDNVRVLPSNLYVFYRNPLNYVGLLASKTMELFFLLYFRLNGRNLTTVFTKNLLAVANRGRGESA